MPSSRYYTRSSISDADESNETPSSSYTDRKKMRCPRPAKKKAPSCTPSSHTTTPEKCPVSLSRIEKYIKVFKVVIVIFLFVFIVWYISDHNYNFFKNELQKLRGHITVMEEYVNKVANKKEECDRQLQEISKSLPVIKEMANDLKDDFRKCAGNCGGGGGGGGGNAIRAGLKGIQSKSWFTGGDSIAQKIRQQIEIYDADKTDMTDFALESSGASIITTRDTKSFTSGPSLSLFGIPLCSSSNNPSALIQPGVMPGECWAFKGSRGTAVIKLVDKIYVTGVSLEHIPRSISPTGDVNTAPKEFSIWGLRCRGDTDGFFFGQFKYITGGTHVQYFPVAHRSTRKFDIIEFKVHSNHGHPEYTCVYRLRVHGDLKKGQEFPDCRGPCNKGGK